MRETDDSIPSYLHRLTQVPLLSAEEENHLTRLAAQGDQAARRKLVEANMRLVINIAKGYKSRHISFDDLVQEGAIGLMHATERFDPSRGFRFSTYATHWIRQSIGRAVDNKSRIIRVPAHIGLTHRRIERERIRLTQELGRDPSHSELAETLGISETKLSLAIASAKDTVSLDVPLRDGRGSSLGALIPDEVSAGPQALVEEQSRSASIREIVYSLSDRERSVIMLKFLPSDDAEEMTTDQIATAMEISKERVRKLEISAVRKLKSIARETCLREII